MEVSMKRQLLKRAWWRWRGEHLLLTTFWPQDYPCKTIQVLNGSPFIITHYVRSSAQPHFFEVWGQPQKRAVALHRDRPKMDASSSH